MADWVVIAPTAEIGADVQIGAFVVIGDGAKIGAGTTLEHHTVVESDATIGNNCHVGNFSKIGARATLGNDVKITAYGEIRADCVVGDRTTFGSRCTLSAGTIVEADVIVKYGFVATDTPKLDEAHKSTCVMKRGSQYGANVALMPGVTVGENSVIGACSQLRDDVGDNEVWFGNPAKRFR